MKTCPYCGKPLDRQQATCHHCKMPVAPKYPSPSELAAQTTKPLQKLLARPIEPYPHGKQSSLETGKQTVTT
jgi:predicted amidophosphoribosyltransferase